MVADVARRGGAGLGAAHHCGNKLAATVVNEMASQVAYGLELVMSTHAETQEKVERLIEVNLVLTSSSRAARTDRHPHSNAIATLAARSGLKSNGTMREKAFGQYGTDDCGTGEWSTGGALEAKGAGSESAEDCYSHARPARLLLPED